MALVGLELETLVSETDAPTTRSPPCALFIVFFYNRIICSIDNGASRRQTRNSRLRARHADHTLLYYTKYFIST